MSGIARAYGLEAGKPLDGSGKAAERYWAEMGPMYAERLLRDRGRLVALYRAHPSSWPDGIDHAGNRWYAAADWADDGTFLGSQHPPRDEAEYKRRVTLARDVLVAAEKAASVTDKRGKPVTDNPVTDKLADLVDVVTDNLASCVQCGKTFDPKRVDAKFCSTACRTASHRAGART